DRGADGDTRGEGSTGADAGDAGRGHAAFQVVAEGGRGGRLAQGGAAGGGHDGGGTGVPAGCATKGDFPAGAGGEGVAYHAGGAATGGGGDGLRADLCADAQAGNAW